MEKINDQWAGHPNIRILCSMDNKFKTLAPFKSMPRLEELYMQSNAITSLTGWESLPALKKLVLRRNKIDKIEEMPIPDPSRSEALMRNIREHIERVISLGKVLSPDILMVVDDINDPGRLADLVASNRVISPSKEVRLSKSSLNSFWFGMYTPITYADINKNTAPTATSTWAVISGLFMSLMIEIPHAQRHENMHLFNTH